MSEVNGYASEFRTSTSFQNGRYRAKNQSEGRIRTTKGWRPIAPNALTRKLIQRLGALPGFGGGAWIGWTLRRLLWLLIQMYGFAGCLALIPRVVSRKPPVSYREKSVRVLQAGWSRISSSAVLVRLFPGSTRGQGEAPEG